MDKLDLEVESLMLDHHNPRIGNVVSQPAALKAIIDLDPRHFKTMMESIKEHGLDPGDAFYVVEEDGEYIVVDGNRRLAALQVLLEPNLLVGAGVEDPVKARLAKAAKDFDVKSISSVDCVLFDSRSDADEWILRRHGRGMEGETRIHWGTLEIQRFQRDQTILDVIEFVGKNSTYTDDRWLAIRAAVEKKSSVLKRFVESKPVRELLGIAVNDENGERVPSFKAEPEAALGVLGQIFEDIADNEIDTRTHNKAEDIKDYVDELPKSVRPRRKPAVKAASIKFSEATVTGGNRPRQSAPAPSTKSSKRTAAKPPRLTLAPRRHPFAQPQDPKGQRLLHEASKLRLKEMPLSCAFVFRAFLEHTLGTYMHAHGIPIMDKNGMRLDLKKQAERVIDQLVSSGSAKSEDLRGARRTMTVSTDPASIQALNDYHHNKFHTPSGDALRAAWDSCEALYIAIYGSP